MCWMIKGLDSVYLVRAEPQADLPDESSGTVKKPKPVSLLGKSTTTPCRDIAKSLHTPPLTGLPRPQPERGGRRLSEAARGRLLERLPGHRIGGLPPPSPGAISTAAAHRAKRLARGRKAETGSRRRRGPPSCLGRVDPHSV